MPVKSRRSARARVACLVALATASASLPASADPTKAQCMDANEAAQTSRSEGKLRDAIAKLKVCIAKSCPGPVRQDCTERLNELQQLLPTLVFEVKNNAGADLIDVRVSMDGAPLAPRLDGTAIAVDPGPHAFRFEADGLAPLDQQLLVREGDRARHERVVLRPVVVAAPLATDAASKAGRGTPPMRLGSYAAFGVGAAGVLTGTVFGVLALGNKSGLNAHCTGGTCPASEQTDINGLSTNGAISTVGFGLGIAGLAAGTVLFLLSRTSDAAPPTAQPTVAFRLGGAGLEGVF